MQLIAILRTLAVAALISVGSAHAALTLTINSASSNHLSLSISGTFDANTVGESEGYLAIKNNWSNNVGTHTEWFAVEPTVISTVTIGGLLAAYALQNSTGTWMDNFFFMNPFGSETPIAAGTEVTGNIEFTGIGSFDVSTLSTLQLVSGFNRPFGHDDWARLEATAVFANAVPEPGSLALLGLGLVGLAASRKRKQA